MTLRRSRLCAVFACMLLASVASSGPAFTQEAVGIPAVIQGDELDPQLEQRLLALDPQSISEQDVGRSIRWRPLPSS
jgi:hypothetical protein